jgi:hypothetical protein
MQNWDDKYCLQKEYNMQDQSNNFGQVDFLF